MKRWTACIAIMALALSATCKREEAPRKEDAVLAKKFAKYRVGVNRDQALKTWMATLEKGEDVDLLSEETAQRKGGRDVSISKIRLAGGSEGFIESRHLADRTIVFTEDTPAFVRPTSGSRLHVKIPRGTIAFVVAEHANWVKVYAGKIDGIWVTEQWVQGGYSADQQLLVPARMYESALGLLASKKAEDRAQGRQKLMELGEGDTIFAELARTKLSADDIPKDTVQDVPGKSADKEVKEEPEAPERQDPPSG